MSQPPEGRSSAYSSAGVNYTALDAGKRNALTQALATSRLLSARGGRAVDESRGEPAFVFESGGQTFALTSYTQSPPASTFAVPQGATVVTLPGGITAP